MMSDCYAKTTMNGDEIKNLNNNKKEDFCCNYCDKKFNTLKDTTCHENLYCKNNKTKKKNICYRCGREGHYSTNCYASKHLNGKYLS